MDAARQKVVLYDSLTQEVVASLGTVSPEGGFDGHLVNSLVHCLDYGGAQGLGHITNTKTDDALLGMRHFVGIYPFSYLIEEIIVRELKKVLIYKCHIFICLCLMLLLFFYLLWRLMSSLYANSAEQAVLCWLNITRGSSLGAKNQLQSILRSRTRQVLTA